MTNEGSNRKASYNHTPVARDDLKAIHELQGLNATEAVHRGLNVLRLLLEAQKAGDKIQLVDTKTGEVTRIFLA